jgi:hypothetical protein
MDLISKLPSIIALKPILITTFSQKNWIINQRKYIRREFMEKGYGLNGKLFQGTMREM